MQTRAVAPVATLIAWTLLAAAAAAQPASPLAESWTEAWSLLMAGGPAVLALGWLRLRRSRLGDALDQLRARHAGLIASALRMREAGGLIPLLAGNGPQVRALNRRFRKTIEEANRLSAQLDQAASALGRWRLGLAHGALIALEGQVAAFEREVAEVEAAMRNLHADVHECLRYMAVVRALHDEIQAFLGKRDWGWDQDVREALQAMGAQIDEAERKRTTGDPVEALRMTRGIQAALLLQKQVLEARQASLTWLQSAPAEVRRLKGEERRLAEAGFRDLPEVDVPAVERAAQAAIAALTRGRVGEAAAKQHALRHEIKRLRAALVGREELYWANRRHLSALKTELANIEAQLQAVHEADCRSRYPRRFWQSASELADALRAELGAVTAHLDAAEAANDMRVQDFAHSHDQLRLARAKTQELRESVARCQAMWLALPRRERELKDRTLSLLGEAAEAKARARELGVAVDPGLMAIIDEVQASMGALPIDLEAATRALSAAERALDRFRARTASLESRLDRAPGGAGRPGAVTLTRVEIPFEAEQAEGRRG